MVFGSGVRQPRQSLGRRKSASGLERLKDQASVAKRLLTGPDCTRARKQAGPQFATRFACAPLAPIVVVQFLRPGRAGRPSLGAYGEIIAPTVPTAIIASSVQFSYGQGSANHHLGCDSSPQRSCLLEVSGTHPNGLGIARPPF
jgi:hypothetical protein